MSKTEQQQHNGKLTAPRRCHVIKVPDFDGYGFNLHAEKGKPGQYIGKVDDASPAELAGLRQGDRIIEVNGVNIGRETHKEVVQRIKAIANEVQLLVVDASVTVSKDNRIVDVVVDVPTVAVAAAPSNGGATTASTEQAVFVPPPPPRDTLLAAPTPDIVVQLPSAPSSPKDDDSVRSLSVVSADTVDNVRVEVDSALQQNGERGSLTKQPEVPQQQPQQQRFSGAPLGEDIIPITIKTSEPVAPLVASTNATSTFSTTPKDHGQTNGNGFSSSTITTTATATSSSSFSSSSSSTANNTKFISTASFSTSELIESEKQSTTIHSVTDVSTAHSEQQQQRQLDSVSQPEAVTNDAGTITPTTVAVVTASSTSPPSPSATKVSATSASSPPQSPTSHNSIVANNIGNNSNINNNNNNNKTTTTTSSSSSGSSSSSPPVAPLVAPAAPKPTDTTKSSSGLNLNMTVAELRAKLAAKKKFDPKSDAVDLRKKYEIVEKL